MAGNITQLGIPLPVPVASGGTGDDSLTAYAPVCGGTTSTGNLQSASTGISTSGYVLTSNGASALPSFQVNAASNVEITGDAGQTIDGWQFTFTGDSTGLTFTGDEDTSTMTLGGELVVANGGTGADTLTGVLIGHGTSAVTGNAVTQYNVLIGGSSNAITSVAPSSTSGIALVSAGSSSNPTFGTVVVPGGGTGITSATAYAPICAGTTSTGAFQVASTGLSTAGYVLTSNGSSALPSFQAQGSSSISITGDAGTTQTGDAFTFSGGSTGMTFTGATDTLSLGGTLKVANGGTGATTLSGVLIGNGTSAVTGNPVNQYDVLVGGASNAINSITPSSTAGIPLVSGGTSANPSFTTAIVAGGGTGITSATAYAPIIGGTTSTGAFQSASSGISNSGYVLTSTGSSSAPTWQAVSSSGGALVFIATQSGSSVTSLTITSGISSTYDNYYLVYRVSNSSISAFVNPYVQISDDGGESWADQYSLAYLYNTTTFPATSQSAYSAGGYCLVLGAGTSSDSLTLWTACGTANLCNLTASNNGPFATFNSQIFGTYDSSNVGATLNGTGFYWPGSLATNALKFAMSDGSAFYGYITLYGYTVS